MHLLSTIRGGLVILALTISFVCQAAELPALINLAVGDATPVLRIYGQNAGDYLGSENGNGIAFGDVNGDGFDDMLIGAYVADPRLPQATDTGVVYVVYGGATIPNTIVNLSYYSTLRRTTRVYGDDPRDSAGYSVASGDVNGDGFDDILIGALFADRIGGATTEYDAGKAYVIYGSATRPGKVIDLSKDAGTYGETRIIGRSGLTSATESITYTPGDLAGWSMGSGDINADGYDDVIIGARAADPGGLSDAGEVYVVYGGTDIAGATIDLRDTPSTNGFVRILGTQAGGFLGWSVASGDANGDGYDDLFLGAYSATVSSITKGITYVIYGSSSLSSLINLSSTSEPITQIYGNSKWDHLGWSMGAGDVNADGYDDVIIGAVGVDNGAQASVGGAYVIYGKSSLDQTNTINLANTFSPATATLIRGSTAADMVGWSAAGGDIDGDGRDDVILGVVGADGTAGGDTGGLIVVPAPLLQNTAIVDLANTTGTIMVTGEHSLDLLGYGGEAGGDVDRDGYADFAGSAIYGDNPRLGSDNDSGAAYVIFGDGTTEVASFNEFYRSGVAPKRGIGGRLSPVARVWLEFNGGTNTSLASVSLSRSNASVSGFDDPNARKSEALWHISSDRVGFTTATVTIQYLDSEKTGMNERGLILYHAISPAGPWTQVASQTLDTNRNEVRAEVFYTQFNEQTYYTFSPHNADLPPVIDLNVPPGEESSPVARIYGDNSDDFLGSSNGNGIAFGDINGDGYDDVVIGATGTEPDGRTNAGDVYILYGTSTLLTKTVNLNNRPGFYGETRILGASNTDQAGYSVACGDLNSDRFDDVIIGIPKSDPSDRTNAGEVQVIYGGPHLPDTTLELSAKSFPNQKISIYGQAAGDNAGFSVTAGDINGDGYDDAVMGAPFADDGTNSNVGRAYVVYGGRILSATTIDLAGSVGRDGETQIYGDDAGDHFGFSLAAGDVSGDGIDDVIAGAPGASPYSRTAAGEVYVVDGKTGKPGIASASGSVVDLDTDGSINADVKEVRILGETIGDHAGCSVAMGNMAKFTGSEYNDTIIIGALYANADGDTNAGKAYVVYSNWIKRGEIIDLASTTNATTYILGENVNDLLGVSVAAGDINGDGNDDVIVGAIQADPSGGTNAGKVYVINASINLPNSVITSMTDSASVMVWGDNEGDLLGYGVESGADVDRNGFADFITSARLGDNPYFTPTDNNAGLGALIFGDGSAESATVIENFSISGKRRGVGGHLSPVARTWIDFTPIENSSDDRGQIWVILHRSKELAQTLGNATQSDLADVVWEVSLSSSIDDTTTTTITFQYLDSEITRLYEPGLRLYQGGYDNTGTQLDTWTDIAGQILDITRNTITATVTDWNKGHSFAIKLPQEIEITGAPLLFGDLRYGCEEATKTLEIWNRGLSDLNFSGFSIIGPASADYRIINSSTELMAPLPAGASREVAIAFLPTATGTRIAYLQVLSDDPDEPVSLARLEGISNDSYLEIIPDYVDFGNVEIGPPDRSATRTVTLRSVGNVPFEFSRLAILGEASREYSIIAPVTGTTNPLAPGQERVLTIAFNPSSLRIRNATLVANSIAYSTTCPQITAEAILSGTGTGDAPEIRINPARLNFGRRDLCAGLSPAQAIRISNIGTQPLEWTGKGLAITGLARADFIILTPTATLVANPLAPGASITIEIAFLPTALGPRNARLVITTNDGDEGTLIVPLSGRGEETIITITPPEEELDFGDLAVCGAVSATQTLTILNEGTRALNFTGDGFSFEGPAASEYRILSPTGSELTRPLAPNRTRTLVIAFHPLAKSLRRARLVMTTDDCHRPTIRIRLYGRGNKPEIDVHPTQLDFGTVDINPTPPGPESATQTVYIRNLGNYYLNFTDESFTFLGEASAEYFIDTPTPTLLAPLQAGTTREVVIAFNPSSLYIRNATLAINTDDCAEPTASVALIGSGTGFAPEIEVLPKKLNFGDWNIHAGDTLSQSIIIHNIGNMPLSFIPPGIIRSGAQASDFEVLNSTASITASAIPPDGTRALYIAFNPSDLGLRQGGIVITTNDGDEPRIIIPFTGEGVDPDIDVTPDSLDFDALDVCGADSATQTVTIRNTGMGALSFTGQGIIFTGVGVADYNVVSPTTGAADPLPPGEERTLVIAFDPVSYGRRKAQMLILTNDYDESTVSVALSGRGLGPEIEILPADLSMEFGPVPVCGGTYASQAFTIKNKGNRPLEFVDAGIGFTGLARHDFYLLSGTLDALPVGTSRLFEVAFDPTVRGRRKARMMIYTNDCDESQISIPLTGFGTAPEIDIPSDQLSLDFENAYTGTSTAPTQTVTIRNLGNTPLNFLDGGITFSLPDYSIVSPNVDATAAIEPFQERDIVVAFNPTVPGRRKGMMVITTDDCDEGVIEIPVFGFGLGANIEILPADLSLEFERVSLCGETYASETFTIQNKGNRPLEFVGPGIEFTGRARNDFYILSPTTEALDAIPVGTSRLFEVAFDPTTQGRRRARMMIYTNDYDESQISIPLTGFGIAPEIDIPSGQLALDFENTYTCATTASTQTVTIRNRGNLPLHFLAGGITFSLSDYSVADATTEIAPFQERNFVVAFNPTSPGRKKGVMTITTDDCDEGIIEIPLFGFGLGPNIAVTPTSVDFGTGSVSGGAAATKTVTLRNEGNRTLNFTSIAITGTHTSDFALVSPTTGLTDPLAGLQTRTLSLQFDPTALGARSAVLTITSDDCNEPTVEIPLSGTGSPTRDTVEVETWDGTSDVREWRGYE